MNSMDSIYCFTTVDCQEWKILAMDDFIIDLTQRSDDSGPSQSPKCCSKGEEVIDLTSPPVTKNPRPVSLFDMVINGSSQQRPCTASTLSDGQRNSRDVAKMGTSSIDAMGDCSDSMHSLASEGSVGSSLLAMLDLKEQEVFPLLPPCSLPSQRQPDQVSSATISRRRKTEQTCPCPCPSTSSSLSTSIIHTSDYLLSNPSSSSSASGSTSTSFLSLSAAIISSTSSAIASSPPSNGSSNVGTIANKPQNNKSKKEKQPKQSLGSRAVLHKFLNLPPPSSSSSEEGACHSHLRAEEYDVILLVDQRERAHDQVVAGLLGEGIPCRLATLAVGDFLWIARPRPSANSRGVPHGISGNNITTESSSSTCSSELDCSDTEGDIEVSTSSTISERRTALPMTKKTKKKATPNREDEGDDLHAESCLILDTIAERKTVADLASSLCDGRYYDQKQRLHHTMIPICWYVVEAESMVLPSQQKNISVDHIKSAMVSTFIESKMHVLKTRGFDHTIRSLAQIHRQVQRRFQEKCKGGALLSSFQRFSVFQESYTRKQCSTYGELFLCQLRQIQGCSMGTANAICKHFQTCGQFMDFLRQTDRAFAVNFLANLYKVESLVNTQETAASMEDSPSDHDKENDHPSHTNTMPTSLMLPVEKDRWAQNNQSIGSMPAKQTSASCKGGRRKMRIGPSLAQEIYRVFAEDY